MNKSTKLIIYCAVFLAFVGAMAGWMTSCALDSKRANEQEAQKMYAEVKTDYDSGKLAKAQEILNKMKKEYSDCEYTQKAVNDFKDLPEKIAQEKKKQEELKKAKQAEYDKKLPAAIDFFNKMLSNNRGHAMYAGCNVQGNTVIVYVNDYWNDLSKDVKEGWVKIYMTNWINALEVKGIKTKMEDWHLKIVHNMSGRTLATWDDVWGISIK